MKQKFEENKVNLQNITKLVSELKTKEVHTEKSLKGARNDLEQVRQEEHAVTEELKTLRVKVEESRSSFQASRSRGRVLDYLMQLKREGTLPGLFGRLVIIFSLF